MESDVEINCLSLCGSKIVRTHRPMNSRTRRRRRADMNSEDGRHDLCLSTRVMQHPLTPPNSPLVMQMYNHKKARESVMKRVQEQTERAKKKRLLYLKTTSGIELSTTPGDVKTKEVPLRHSHNSDPTTNRSPKLLPPIDDANYNNLTGSIKHHTGGKSHGLRPKPVYRQNGQPLTHKPEEPSDKSNHKIKFDLNTNDANNDDDDENFDDDDENDDNKSYDSIAIQSIFVNNCNRDNPPKTDRLWSHRNVPKNTSWSPLQESYKGYLYKNNGTIVLTRKYQPLSHSNPYKKTRAETNGKLKKNKMYRWGYMDPGRILNKQISALSITGTHA